MKTGKISAAILLTATFALRSGAPGARAQAEPPRQYEIKAAFLYKFIDFIEWPPDTRPTITIGILGKDPFGAALDTIRGKIVRGKRLVIRHLDAAEDLESVSVLFISPSEKEHLKQILRRVRSSSILTISEIDGFAESGGILNLTTQNNKVRFEINPDAALRARLRISSHLLRLAKIVRA